MPTNRRKIRCIETGEVWNTVSEAAKSNNVTIMCFYHYFHGVSKSVAGLHFEYADAISDSPVRCKRVRCVETGHVFGSIAEAAETLHMSRAMVSAAASGKIKAACGKHFEFVKGDAG